MEMMAAFPLADEAIKARGAQLKVAEINNSPHFAARPVVPVDPAVRQRQVRFEELTFRYDNDALNMTEAHRKELIYQQTKFLKKAEQLVSYYPWISAIASIKHNAILAKYPADSATFLEISDKEYIDAANDLSSEIISRCDRCLDPETKGFLITLVSLQICFGCIVECAETVHNAIQAGYNCFEPPIEKPQNKSIGAMALAFVIGGIAILIVFQLPESITNGTFFGILLALGIVLLGLPAQYLHSKYQKQNEKYSYFMKLREAYYAFSNGIAIELGFNAKKMALDLEESRTQLHALIDQRKQLQEYYIPTHIDYKNKCN